MRQKMTNQDIEKAEKLADAIKNFKNAYSSCVLWGSAPDGDVRPEQLIEWLVENPHMAEIAAEIHKMRKK